MSDVNWFAQVHSFASCLRTDEHKWGKSYLEMPSPELLCCGGDHMVATAECRVWQYLLHEVVLKRKGESASEMLNIVPDAKNVLNENWLFDFITDALRGSLM